MSDLVVKNQELMSVFGQSVNVGTEDAGEAGKYPMVKITSSMSRDNILANGKKSEVGKLFHTELRQDFDEINANICYIGKFSLPDFTTKEPKMTYVFGAVKQDDNTPFVMYVKGFSLQSVWDFLGEVSDIKTRFSIPMFALNTTVKVGQRSHEKFGQVDVFKFEILRDGDGNPVVEQDLDRAKSLLALVDKFKEIIQLMNKGPEQEDEYTAQASSPVRQQTAPDEVAIDEETGEVEGF